MACVSGFAKCLLFIFNIIIALCGLVVVTFGAILFTHERKSVEGPLTFSISGFAIAIGIFIFIVAFFGCCGAVTESSCMLTTYAIILTTLLVLQIILGVLAFVGIQNGPDQMEIKVEDSVEELFGQYNNDPEKKLVVDEIQADLKCCGVKGPIYWKLDVPPSCCGGTTTSCNQLNAYQTGCTQALTNVFVSYIKIIGGIVLGFAVLELLGAILACIARSNQQYRLSGY